MTDLGFERPSDFQPSREWGNITDEMERRRSMVSATVLMLARHLPVLRKQIGRHCQLLETTDDGRIRVRVAAHLPIAVAEALAGWGGTVEMLEPDSVKPSWPASDQSLWPATGPLTANQAGLLQREAAP